MFVYDVYYSRMVLSDIHQVQILKTDLIFSYFLFNFFQVLFKKIFFFILFRFVEWWKREGVFIFFWLFFIFCNAVRVFPVEREAIRFYLSVVWVSVERVVFHIFLLCLCCVCFVQVFSWMDFFVHVVYFFDACIFLWLILVSCGILEVWRVMVWRIWVSYVFFFNLYFSSRLIRFTLYSTV
jgi:hypothetical protein